MTLADLYPQLSTLTLDQARGLALVFADPLRITLAEIQAAHGDPRHRAEPVALPDGRWMLCADLLTEVAPGELFHAGFSRLPADRFAEVEVIPMANLVETPGDQTFPTP